MGVEEAADGCMYSGALVVVAVVVVVVSELRRLMALGGRAEMRFPGAVILDIPLHYIRILSRLKGSICPPLHLHPPHITL